MSSRRDAIQMTPAEIRAYLRAQTRLILVSNGSDGFPHPMPMNFALDEADRYVITTFRKSQKVKNFERDPRAALLVESGVAYAELKSVLAYADAEIVEDVETTLHTMALLAAKEASLSNANPEDLLRQARISAPKRLTIRFAPHKYISWDHGKLGGQY